MSARTLEGGAVANVSRRGLLAGVGAGALVLAVGVPPAADAQQPKGFGADGMQRAVQAASAPTAAATAMAIQDAVMSAATDPLQDDATLVVLAVD